MTQLLMKMSRTLLGSPGAGRGASGPTSVHPRLPQRPGQPRCPSRSRRASLQQAEGCLWLATIIRGD